MEGNKIHKMFIGDVEFELEDTVSGYIKKDVDDLDNYTTTADLNTRLAAKADVEDVPTAGTISAGSEGYATGGDIYNSLNSIQSRLAAL